MEGQSGPVPDGILEGIAVEIPLFVLIRPKSSKSVSVGPVDRSAGQAEKKGVGKGFPHLAAEIAFLGAVGFVYHSDNIGPFVQSPSRLAELVNGGDEDLADILGEQILQFLPCGNTHHVGHIVRVEGCGDLSIEIDAVHHDDHRGISQPGTHPELLGGEHHEEGFAASLEIPDESFPGLALHHPVHHLVGGLELLVAADDLDAPVFFVRGNEGEVLKNSNRISTIAAMEILTVILSPWQPTSVSAAQDSNPSSAP